MRQIALDTETTGLKPEEGHRIVEVACVEIVGRSITERSFQTTINPQREVDEDARKIHGYTWEMLKDSPLFADIYDELISFVQGAQILIHNARFDLGFLDSELQRLGRKNFLTEAQCTVADTLKMAKRRHLQPRTLDALCDRYGIDRSHRKLHDALKDARLLAQIYLAMTKGE